MGRLRFEPAAVVLLGVGVFLCVLVGLPLALLAYYALTDEQGTFTLVNVGRLLTDEALLAPLRISLLVAACVGCLSTLVAAPLAWLVARTDMPGRGFVRVLVTASFLFSDECSEHTNPHRLQKSSLPVARVGTRAFSLSCSARRVADDSTSELGKPLQRGPIVSACR